ncbi:LysR family transcriptional regulator [Simiduia agarivorans]|uniref:LysR family transcriptional regulator n=1 Tax=Simiduia agarivorans (strain DSM 21679 / JCM 13881 / BCRC 17597 / SA1) TaxID=1117647 RepID=K4KIK6_SIMAS|nr:LysR family transcriptional regulator [Simiduia agarivorans]AFU98856.1 LysR family transcriptional regulator [Simiduia agarivorans SA1 = DSM 21679]
MDIRQLHVFIAVADSGSFTSAANQLHIAQSAISVSIRKLEQSLGVQLFDRTERRSTLTAEGQVLLSRARQLIAQFEQTRLEMSDLGGLKRGKVRLGTSAMVGSYFLPSLIAEFRARHPAIDFEVSGEGTRAAQARLLAGDIDMAVVNLRELPSQLAGCQLIAQNLVACMSPSHPLATRKRVALEDLLAQPLVVYGKGYFLRDWLEAEAQKRGVALRIALETNLLRLMTEYVAAGQGVALTLEMMASAEPALKGVPISGAKPLELGIAWRKDRYLSLANQAFVDFLVERNATQ